MTSLPDISAGTNEILITWCAGATARGAPASYGCNYSNYGCAYRTDGKTWRALRSPAQHRYRYKWISDACSLSLISLALPPRHCTALRSNREIRQVIPSSSQEVQSCTVLRHRDHFNPNFQFIM